MIAATALVGFGNEEGLRQMNPPDPSVATSLEWVRGMHLGRCARRILLLAPDPSDDAQVLPAERDGRAAAESHRRAMRRLAEVGLVELSWKTEQVQTKREKQAGPLLWDEKAGQYREGKRRQIPVLRSIERRAVRLTPLGALLVDRLRPVLETGERIRWASIIASESQ